MKSVDLEEKLVRQWVGHIEEYKNNGLISIRPGSLVELAFLESAIFEDKNILIIKIVVNEAAQLEIALRLTFSWLQCHTSSLKHLSNLETVCHLLELSDSYNSYSMVCREQNRMSDMRVVQILQEY